MTHADNGSYPLKTLWFLALIFSMLSVGIIVIGYIYYQNHVSLFLTEKEGELKSIADMKVDQISVWRAERVHDAQQVSDDPLLASEVFDWFNGKQAGHEKEKILAYLQGMKQELYEAIWLIDSQAVVRLSIPAMPSELDQEVTLICREALSTGKIVFTDLQRAPLSNKIYLALAAPIYYTDKSKKVIVGAVVYRIDPDRVLFPILRSWPTPSKTGELIMVRRVPGEDTESFPQ